MLGSGEQRGADHGHEHQPDEGGQHLLEHPVAARPDQREADEAGDDAPPGDREPPGQRGEREPGAGHRGGAVDEAPDHDVGREVPRRPDAEGAPALEDRLPGGEGVTARPRPARSSSGSRRRRTTAACSRTLPAISVATRSAAPTPVAATTRPGPMMLQRGTRSPAEVEEAMCVTLGTWG